MEGKTAYEEERKSQEALLSFITDKSSYRSADDTRMQDCMHDVAHTGQETHTHTHH